MTEALIALTAVLVLAVARIPLGFAMAIVGTIGFAALRGPIAAVETVGQLILDFSMSYTFAVLPMFVLMGAFVHRSALSKDLYEASYAWLGHFRGGLSMATVAASAGFGAACGSSVATAATMGRVALPSMRRFGYDPGLAAGTIAAGGTLGILIPPSMSLVVYGFLTQQDIGRLFIAGIVPALITVVLYFCVIAIVTRLKPQAGPPGPRTAWADRFRKLGKVYGVLLLFVLVLGGIYFGVFTPNEAGGVGAVGACLIAISRRHLNWQAFVDSLIEAARTTTMVFSVAFGAVILSNFVTVAGLPETIANGINALNLPGLAVIITICLVYILLGCVFDGLALLFLTVPVFAPMVVTLGYDLIWFGIVVIIVSEIALITPPIGMNVFVLKSMNPEFSLRTIFGGIAPFLVADLVRLTIVLLVPGVVLYLPQLMR